MTNVPFLFAIALSLALAPVPVLAAGPRTTATKSAPTTRSTTKPKPATKTSSKRKSRSSGRAKSKKRTAVPRASARRAAVKPAQSPAGSAAMASLLRQYVGSKGNKFNRKVQAKMEKQGVSKDAARRILARIDGASRSARRAAFGTATTGSSPGKSDMKAAMVASATEPTVMKLLPAITLEPEGVPKPASFKLERAGLVTLATEDQDGSDELTMFAMLVTPSGNDYTVSTVELGSAHAAGPGAQALGTTLYSGPNSDTLVVTALIEDDDGNAASAREEIELLVGLAASVAATMPGTDRLQVLQAMVDYTIGLDAIGADPGRAARSVVATAVPESEWFPLWSLDHSKTSGIDWKLAIPHTMGSGSYELLLDVPDTMPSMQTVRIRVTGAQFDPVGAAFTLDRSSLTVRIGNRSHVYSMLDMPAGTFKAVERKVAAGHVEIGLSGELQYHRTLPANIVKYCADAKTAGQKARCKRKKKPYLHSEERDVDLAVGYGKSYTTTYSTGSGGFLKAADTKKGASTPSAQAPSTPPKPLRTKTAKGTDAPGGVVTISGTNQSG